MDPCSSDPVLFNSPLYYILKTYAEIHNIFWVCWGSLKYSLAMWFLLTAFHELLGLLCPPAGLKLLSFLPLTRCTTLNRSLKFSGPFVFSIKNEGRGLWGFWRLSLDHYNEGKGQQASVRDGKLESTQQVGMSEYLSLCVAGDVGSVVIKENHIFFFWFGCS